MVDIGAWREILPADALDLAEQLETRTRSMDKICPPPDQIFRALRLTQPDSVKAVIVGQDPYHTEGVANGLAFSTNPGQKIPPSLQNIFKEMAADLNCPKPTSGDLTPWAEQGALLLNTVLTVEQGSGKDKANSHKRWGWQKFTCEVLRTCAQLPQPVFFMLWGADARAFAAGVAPGNLKNKGVIFSSHPSPLGATKGDETCPAFLGSKPFSAANRFLKAWGSTPVDWSCLP